MDGSRARVSARLDRSLSHPSQLKLAFVELARNRNRSVGHGQTHRRMLTHASIGAVFLILAAATTAAATMAARVGGSFRGSSRHARLAGAMQRDLRVCLHAHAPAGRVSGRVAARRVVFVALARRRKSRADSRLSRAPRSQTRPTLDAAVHRRVSTAHERRFARRAHRRAMGAGESWVPPAARVSARVGRVVCARAGAAGDRRSAAARRRASKVGDGDAWHPAEVGVSCTHAPIAAAPATKASEPPPTRVQQQLLSSPLSQQRPPKCLGTSIVAAIPQCE
mmetsp:Transcript_996/g.1945  ORF Transcript_996/g.1945 Transcript_996/m.1945 type:complete len:280 (-) Transcript_996:516-1355(-)